MLYCPYCYCSYYSDCYYFYCSFSQCPFQPSSIIGVCLSSMLRPCFGVLMITFVPRVWLCYCFSTYIIFVFSLRCPFLGSRGGLCAKSACVPCYCWCLRVLSIFFSSMGMWVGLLVWSLPSWCSCACFGVLAVCWVWHCWHGGWLFVPCLPVYDNFCLGHQIHFIIG